MRKSQNMTPFRLNPRRGPKTNASITTARFVNGMIAKWEEVTSRDLSKTPEANAVQDFYFLVLTFMHHTFEIKVALENGELATRQWQSRRLAREIRVDLPKGVARRRAALSN